jgi:hypothetical protein
MKVIWPEYISLKDWSAALIFDYYNEPLPILENDNNWPQWGAIVAGTGVFANNNIPSPLSFGKSKNSPEFKDWQAWAKVVYNIMSNEKK